MCANAAVHDVHASVLVLVAANGRIGNRAVRRLELLDRDRGHVAPVRVRRVEIETLVEVDPGPEARFVDLEVAPKPETEEADHARIAVREHDLAVTLRPFTGVQRDAG